MTQDDHIVMERQDPDLRADAWVRWRPGDPIGYIRERIPNFGVPFQFEHARYRDAVQKVADAARKAGKPAGVGLLGDPSDPDTCSDVVEQGFTVFLAGGDQWSLVDAFRKTTEAYSRAKR